MGTKTGRPTAYDTAFAVAEEVLDAMESAHLPGWLGVDLAGSLRRQKDVVSDVDLVVWTEPDVDDLSVWNEQWSKFPGNDVLPIRWTPKGGAGDVRDVRVELYKAPSLDCVGATMVFTTGPASLNVYMRQEAIKRGWKLSQYGIVDAAGVRQDGCDGDDFDEDERQMFLTLGLPYLLPHERENWRQHVKTPRP